MKKKPWLCALEAGIFVLLLAVLLPMLSGVMQRKESRNLFGTFLEEPQSYDVLFFGDSRLMNAMLPLESWNDYGIAGYNLSCYGNLMPVSYWTMMNALDYAEPKLVVFAVNDIHEPRKTTRYSSDLHTALDFWPLSRTKMRAIEDLMHDDENPENKDNHGDDFQDIKWEFYATLGKYHSRWSELTKDDFRPEPEDSRGGEILTGLHPYWEYDIIDDDQYAEEVGYGFHYLRRTLDECQSRGIDVLLVNLPEPGTINAQKSANTVGSIAEEYGVHYVDLARMDSVVDYAVDCYDEQPHLNASGTQKVTAYLGSYIREHYDIPDRRGEAGYAHWDRMHHAFVNEKTDRLRKLTELNNVLVFLNDRDYDIRMAVGADAPLFYDALGGLLMHNLARENVLVGEEYEKWSNAMYPLAGFDEAMWECLPYYLHRKDGAAWEQTGDEAERMRKEVFGDDPAQVLIEVIDRRTGEQAASFRF